MKGVSILSIPRSLFLSPAHVWKIPCCHLLRGDVQSTNEISGEKRLGEERETGGKKKRERQREREGWRRKEEKGVEETDREKGIETSSYNRLLGSVMKQLSDKFNFLLLPLFSSCLCHHLFLFHLLLCPLLTLSD